MEGRCAVNALGSWGEGYAADLLRQEGAILLEHNYRANHGEIDLIALMGEELLFVEVKTRSSGYLVRPIEAVQLKKRRKIVETAIRYLMEHPEYESCQPRFDIIEIVAVRSGEGYRPLQTDHWKGAFDGNGLV